jgi:hypothetical protein
VEPAVASLPGASAHADVGFVAVGRQPPSQQLARETDGAATQVYLRPACFAGSHGYKSLQVALPGNSAGEMMAREELSQEQERIEMKIQGCERTPAEMPGKEEEVDVVVVEEDHEDEEENGEGEGEGEGEVEEETPAEMPCIEGKTQTQALSTLVVADHGCAMARREKRRSAMCHTLTHTRTCHTSSPISSHSISSCGDAEAGEGGDALRKDADVDEGCGGRGGRGRGRGGAADIQEESCDGVERCGDGDRGGRTMCDDGDRGGRRKKSPTSRGVTGDAETSRRPSRGEKHLVISPYDPAEAESYDVIKAKFQELAKESVDLGSGKDLAPPSRPSRGEPSEGMTTTMPEGATSRQAARDACAGGSPSSSARADSSVVGGSGIDDGCAGEGEGAPAASARGGKGCARCVRSAMSHPLFILCCLASCWGAMSTFVAPPVGVNTGAGDAESACPRPATCVKSTPALVLLAVARASSFFTFPLYPCLFLSKLYSLPRILDAWLEKTLEDEKAQQEDEEDPGDDGHESSQAATRSWMRRGKTRVLRCIAGLHALLRVRDAHALHETCGLAIGAEGVLHVVLHLVRWSLDGKLSPVLTVTGLTGIAGVVVTLVMSLIGMVRPETGILEARRAMQVLSYAWAALLCFHATSFAVIIAPVFGVYVLDRAYDQMMQILYEKYMGDHRVLRRTV